MDLDDTDRPLIALLCRDARLPLTTLAAKRGVSRATVANRLRALKTRIRLPAHR